MNDRWAQCAGPGGWNGEGLFQMIDVIRMILVEEEVVIFVNHDISLTSGP
jgi:hypothetical protein